MAISQEEKKQSRSSYAMQVQHQHTIYKIMFYTVGSMHVCILITYDFTGSEHCVG